MTSDHPLWEVYWGCSRLSTGADRTEIPFSSQILPIWRRDVIGRSPASGQEFGCGNRPDRPGLGAQARGSAATAAIVERPLFESIR